MNRRILLVALASCMSVSACRVMDQRVDLSWFEDTMTPPQVDDVYVETGRGLSDTESPVAAAASATADWAAASAQSPVPEPAPEQLPAPAPAPAVAQAPLPAPATPAPAPSPRVAVQPTQPVAAQAPVTRPSASPRRVPSRTHTVAKGDTLAAIARRYHCSVAAISAANGLENPNALKLGSVLVIPDATAPAAPVVATRQSSTSPQAAASQQATAKRSSWKFWQKSTPAPAPKVYSYTVQQGDTLNAVARRYGVTPSALMQANGITPAQAKQLRIGQKILIPATKK